MTYKTHDTICWSNVGNCYKASGIFYVYQILATNNDNTSNSFESDFITGLFDDRGGSYGELSSADPYAAHKYATLNGFDNLNAGIVPRGTGHFLLVFDAATDATPNKLVIAKADDKNQRIIFELK